MSSDHPWFAVHDDVLYDTKLARVRRSTRLPRLVILGAWTAVLALSNQSPVRGVLLIREDRPLTTQELFDEWEIERGDAAALLNALVDQGMLHQEGDAWVVCNWEKRQPRLDKSTERVQRWRARQKAQAQQKNETPEALHDETDETFRNGTEEEEEIERELEGEGEGGDGGADDEYALERRLAQIVRHGTSPDVGTRPRARYDPDDELAVTLWNKVLKFCGNDQGQAKAVFLVAHELETQLEWVKPMPKSDYEERNAMTDWWRPIKRALEARKWDHDVTARAMVAAAKAMYQRDSYPPSKPSALIGEMSKQKVSKASRASPSGVTGGNDSGGGVGGVDAIREKIRQKRGQQNGRSGSG